jgi:predicted AlkP superfamily phosphohydrolase/phosphomutase
MAPRTTTTPLVVIALDGGDPELIARWSEQGHLPNIASILTRGGRARIRGPELMSTVGAWLSLFSGIPPSEHGYYADRQLVPGGYELRSFSARDARARPFWARLAGGDKKVAIIDALETQPIAGLAGVQLANWSVQQPFDADGDPPSAEPVSFLDETRRLVGEPVRVDVFDPDASVRDDLAASRALLERIEQKGILFRHVAARDRADLTIVSFVEAHTAAHRLWDYRPEGPRYEEAGSAAGELSTAIREAYRAIDREIGLILDALDAGSNVFIVSLFGMRNLYPTDGLTDAFCRQLGYHVPPADAGRRFDPLALLRRKVPPEVRARLSRLLPAGVRRRLQADALAAGADWAETRAFSISSLQTGFIRVNCRGREPHGIVTPGSEYESLLDEMEADLHQLVDVRSGAPAVAKVIRTADAFGCGPPAVLPDLVVEWRSASYLMECVRHPRAELVQTRQHYNRSTHHTMEGFMAACGPSINAGDIGEVSPLELAPAFLELLGQPDGEHAGRRTSKRPLEGLF